MKRIVIITIVIVLIGLGVGTFWFFARNTLCQAIGGHVGYVGGQTPISACFSSKSFSDAGKPCSSNKECESGLCDLKFPNDYGDIGAGLVCQETKILFYMD